VPANLIFIGVGFVVPGLPRLFMFKGVERLGASISSMLINSIPLFAILIAFVFLKERPSLTNLLGAFSIMAGWCAFVGEGRQRPGVLLIYSFS
jgi:drug/metabolite transporter (DMT)-like permease